MNALFKSSSGLALILASALLNLAAVEGVSNSTSGTTTNDSRPTAALEARLADMLKASKETNTAKAISTPLPATNLLASGASTNAPADGTNLVKTNASAAMDTLDDKHRLAIGDKLSFRIEEDLEDPRSLVVTDSGDLETPYLGRFPAENKTCKQLAQEIKTALEKEYDYQATVVIAVDLMAKTRGRVYLVGPLRSPGPQEIPTDEILTLSKAILRAGGFNDYADKQHVKVTRKGSVHADEKQTFVVDVDQIFTKGKTEKDLPLEPGDLVFVPERLIRF